MTRSATSPNPAKPNLGMNAIGLLLAAGTLFLLLPLAPFIVAIWLVDKFRGD